MAVQFNPFTGNLDLVEANAYSALNLLGTVANAAALPGGATAGDVYQAEDTGIFYVWDGAAWDNLGTLVGPQGPKGDTGDAGPAGTNGINGTNGVGVVAGGTTGQALVKASNTDYDTQWSDVTAVAALNDLTDVAIATPVDGQVLEYDSVSGNWINATPTGGGGTPGGSDTQVQFNNAGAFGGSADLTWDNTGKVLGVGGDIDLDDGGTYATTLQVITPTADRTISFPDATGTLALVAGSSGQLIYNNAGANAGLSTAAIGATGDITLSLNGAASTPPLKLTGTWFTGGTATTTKPQVLIEPASTTSSAWSTSGTGLGINAPSGFAGNLLDLQVNGTSAFSVSSGGIAKATETRNGTSVNYSRIWQSGGIGVLSNQAANIAQWGSEFFYSYGALGVRAATGLAILDADAANTLAQRNGTNAQTYRLYNTYTDASNYERVKFGWESNIFRLGIEADGTGNKEREIRLTVDDATFGDLRQSRLRITPEGSLVFDRADQPNSTTGGSHFLFGNSNSSSSTGLGKFAFGANNDVTFNGNYQFAYGWRARTRADYMHAVGVGEVNNSQYGHINYFGATTDATLTEITAGAGGDRLTIPANVTTYASVVVVARSDAGVDHASFERKILLQNTGGTTAIVGSVQSGTDIGSNAGSPPAGWGVTISADNTNDALRLEVTGAAATNITWLARIDFTEVYNA